MASNFPRWSKRGTGKCAVCHTVYYTAWKPKNCVSCDNELGGTYVPKSKKPKLDNPNCVCLVDRVVKIYSCKTSLRGDRCFVNVSETTQICYHDVCKKSRAVTVVSKDSSVAKFTCQHLKMIDNCVRPKGQWFMTEETIAGYPCDLKTKEALKEINEQLMDGWPLVLQVATNMFVVYGQSSASAPLGYVHVMRNNDIYKCTSKDCRSVRSSAAGKQQKVKKFCIHEHILQSVLPNVTTSTGNPSITCPSMSSVAISESADLDQEPSSIVIHERSIQANKKPTIPYLIPLKWINKARAYDAATVLGLKEEGWPLVFSPEDTQCRLCGASLGQPKRHPGSRGKSVFLTNGNPFLVCNIKVKDCTSKTCKALHQVWPIEFGIFNVCDKVLLSLEVLLEWRELFKRGVPLSSAIESKLDYWCKVVKKELVPSSSERLYLARLLYNAFYAFEMLTDRSLDDVICGFCGVIGEFYLGSGNEKNCCLLKGVKDDASSAIVQCDTLQLENILGELTNMWTTQIIFANDDKVHKFTVNASNVPPLIAPAIRNDTVINTERQKSSIYLKSSKKATQGDPALLHHLIISKELEINSLANLELDQLKETAEKCNISVTSGVTKSFLIAELQSLYASLLVGKSSCHGFNKVPGNTGGFYHLVCRHGVIVASKFLLLQESVRDAGDLYLSLRYPPPLFMCNTPCGFARHMDLREPSTSSVLWGDKSGCFEKPVHEKMPDQFSVPEIIPLEYKSTADVVLPKPEDLEEWQHPITGTTRRYVMGDGFHITTEPHKSPLCEFHNINYCEQAFTIKSSFQESENHRKSVLRLRSSTMQSFPVHFTYNYLMDFYHNEQIVLKQIAQLENTLEPNQSLSRDLYRRFIKVKSNLQGK